ncbi:MAG: phosphoethanolamine transferase [Labilithrix sp.]|nr:phosphoethanolamine transferase [Labilithrix sp.]MCW5811798.1 phosphoethanolamine transferase [Labilithrix sp.]
MVVARRLLHRVTPRWMARSVGLAWAALLALDLVARAAYLRPRLVTLRGALNYAAAALALWIVVRLVATTRGRVRTCLHIALITVPVTVQWMVFQSYGAFVTPTDFAAFGEAPRVVLQAAGQASDALGTLVVLAASVATLGLYPRAAKPLGRLRAAALATVLAGGLALGSTYWRASSTLEHPQPAFACAVVGLAKRATVTARGEGRVAVPPAEPLAAGVRLPNIVLVVGESLAASHLTIYGYDRPTSPRLQALHDAGELVAMKDAVVMGPHTRTSVPYIMTGLAGPDPSGRVFRAPTVTEYAKARGYHTAFISAQEESWGDLDAMLREGADVFKTGISFAPQVDVLKGSDDLVMLEKGVLPTLHALAEPFFLVVHMDGSHLPYREHSPPSHKVFPEDGVNSIGAYDNTIRVTDELLARVHAALRERDPDAWMFFTSDHGQPLGEGGAFYNHGYQSNVVRDPLFVLPPAAERSAMRAVADAQTSACDVAPTILHLMHTAPAANAPMDCADWIAGPPPPRVRVVSAYTPAYLLEPTMLVVLPNGRHEVYDLWRGTVTGDDGVARPLAEHTLPREVAARLP